MTKHATKSDESSLKAGQKVLYVPGLDHWHERGMDGAFLFDFEFAEDGPAIPSTRKKATKGERVTRLSELGEFRGFDQAKGTIQTASEHQIRPTGARKPWKAVVREEEVREPREVEVSHADSVHGSEKMIVLVTTGKRLVLDVEHPAGVVTLHLPLDGPGAVPHDPDGKPHTYHLPKED